MEILIKYASVMIPFIYFPKGQNLQHRSYKPGQRQLYDRKTDFVLSDIKGICKIFISLTELMKISYGKLQSD